jgi:hypothetical protein
MEDYMEIEEVLNDHRLTKTMRMRFKNWNEINAYA